MKQPAKIIPLKSRSREKGEKPALTNRDDDELMLLARGGAGGAFDELVRRYQQRVLRIASKHVGDETEAPDIAQCVFLALYNSLAKYEPRGKLPAYLYGIVINQCRMANRSRHYRQEKLAVELPRSVDIVPPEAEEEILAREKRKEVDRALARLSDKLRDVVVLRFAGELSYREIAEALDLPIGTVKSRLFAALERLAGILEGETM